MSTALIVGTLAHAGHDVRVAKDGTIVVRSRASRQTLRRDLPPAYRSIKLESPAPGYFLLVLPLTKTS